MTDPELEPRPPFVVNRDFIETAFEQRFQGWLRHGWQNRSWHVIAAPPGSGKSRGIHDLVRNSGADLAAIGRTRLPVLAVRAPKNDSRDQGLITALASSFPVLPSMSVAFRRLWLVKMLASSHVECLIIDDAQDLNLRHLAFLKELTDNLAAPPYERLLGLGLVAAHGNNDVPFRETFARPETLWKQFRQRMDTQNPYIMIPGHTEEELRLILATFEDLYRDQFPDLQLHRWTKPIFTWLTNPLLDPHATGRVLMGNVTKLVTLALRWAYERRETDVNAKLLGEVADLMTIRRDEITRSDVVLPDSSGENPRREVG
ncbi:MAG: ATP-binding protein [Candidatus Acidiferrum sp.]